MINQKPSQIEQIEALIHHKVYDLMMKYAPSREINAAEAYATVFSVKRNDVLDYLIKNYQLSDLVPMKAADRDGFYAIPERNGFRTYEQFLAWGGGGWMKDSEEIVPDELGVWNKFVDYILGTSGTGLTFD
jgi:hypothetical protein